MSAFDDISAALTPPMVIVTTRFGDEVDGCLVGFTTQCSIDPQRYLVCLSVTNRTYELAQHASTLVVHMLHDTPSDHALASLFGEHTARDTDKLARCDWTPGPDGVPVLEGFVALCCHRYTFHPIHLDSTETRGLRLAPPVSSQTRTSERDA